MSVRSIQFLTSLAACVTDEQAALAVTTALDDGVRPLRDVLQAGLDWCDGNTVQQIQSTAVQTVVTR